MVGEKILVIEDEPDIALMLEDLTRAAGYLPVIAYDGLDGLKLALSEGPDLILVDYRLPKINGLELLSRLHEQDVHIPAVLVTSVRSEELALHALRLGVKDYIKKPFDPAELLAVIAHALEEGRLRRERDRLTDELLASNLQLRTSLTQLTALYQVGQALSSTMDLDELLDLILGVACHVLGGDVVSVYMLDQSRDSLVLRRSVGGRSPREEGAQRPAGRGVVGWVAHHGEPLLLPHATGDPRFDPSVDRVKGVPIESILCVPLTIKGRVLGVLLVVKKSQPGFNEEDLALCRSLAISAAVAVENARLYQNLRESRDQAARRGAELKNVVNKLVHLQRIALALGTLTLGADLYKVYKRLTEYAAVLMEVKGSAIWLFDPERGRLICQKPAFGFSDLGGATYTIPLSPASPLWDAWKKGQSLIANDLPRSPLVAALDLERLVAQQALQTSMFAALRIGGRSIGLFQVADKLDGTLFTPDDQRVLEIFASQCALAVQSARTPSFQTG